MSSASSALVGKDDAIWMSLVRADGATYLLAAEDVLDMVDAAMVVEALLPGREREPKVETAVFHLSIAPVLIFGPLVEQAREK